MNVNVRRRWDGLWLPLAATVASFAVGFLQKLSCQAAGWPRLAAVIYGDRCYSDMPILFRERGFAAGIFPYSAQAWQHPLEYPVLTGLIMDGTARLTRWVSPAADEAALSRTYFVVNTILLLLFALALTAATWLLLRRLGRPGAYALLVAAAPVLMLTGTINWDLVAVAAAVLALLAWHAERPVWAGALIGLGFTAKLFPLFLLGPIILLGIRDRRLRAAFQAIAAAAAVSVLVNLPIAILYPRGWLEFWTFNQGRGADLGSLWYALRLLDWDTAPVNLTAPAVLLLSWCAIAVWALRSPRPPRLDHLALLTIAAFLLTNKVYSPQYVLWVLPFAVLVLADVPWRKALAAWGIWQAAEVWYWYCVWDHLVADRSVRLDQPSGVYIASIAARIAATVLMLWVAVRESRRSAAARAEHLAERADENLDVEPQAPVLDVVVVEARPVGDRSVSA